MILDAIYGKQNKTPENLCKCANCGSSRTKNWGEFDRYERIAALNVFGDTNDSHRQFNDDAKFCSRCFTLVSSRNRSDGPNSV